VTGEIILRFSCKGKQKKAEAETASGAGGGREGGRVGGRGGGGGGGGGGSEDASLGVSHKETEAETASGAGGGREGGRFGGRGGGGEGGGGEREEKTPPWGSRTRRRRQRQPRAQEEEGREDGLEEGEEEEEAEEEEEEEVAVMSFKQMAACPKLFLPMSALEKCDVIQKECDKLGPRYTTSTSYRFHAIFDKYLKKAGKATTLPEKFEWATAILVSG